MTVEHKKFQDGDTFTIEHAGTFSLAAAYDGQGTSGTAVLKVTQLGVGPIDVSLTTLQQSKQ